MKSRIGIVLFGAACFLAGSCVAQTSGPTSYGDEDLPFAHSHCASQNCSPAPFTMPTGLPPSGKLVAQDCPYYLSPASPAPAGSGIAGTEYQPIDLGGERSLVAKNLGSAAENAKPAPVPTAQVPLKPPYIFIVLERCTGYPQGPNPSETRVTTQIITIPYPTNAQKLGVTIETRRY